VFETTDISKGWDGTFKGKEMNTAVFVWYVRAKFVNGDLFINKGDVSLIR
jgi:hypothetical protein